MLECSLFEFSGLLFSSLINSIPHKWGANIPALTEKHQKEPSNPLLIVSGLRLPPTVPLSPPIFSAFLPLKVTAPSFSYLLPPDLLKVRDNSQTRPLLNLSKRHALVKGNKGYWIYQWKLLERTWCVYPLISTSFKINHIKWINDVRIPDVISRNNYYGNLYSSPGCWIMFNSVLSQSRVGGDWIRSSYLTAAFLVTLVSLYNYFSHIYFFMCLPVLGARKCVPRTRLSSQGCNLFYFCMNSMLPVVFSTL